MSQSARHHALEHVDAVVVGSGFGGSVATYRLAEADQSVVLLERGHDYPPGSFARSPAEMRRAFWDPSEGLYGLFDIWAFRGFESVVSSGLGGGSLIYANVLLRKDERWFVHEDPLPGGGYEKWPISRADLDPHYDAVERMIGVTRYPVNKPAFDTPKTHAMRQAATNLGLDWQLPPLAVSFASRPGDEPEVGVPIVEPEYGNLHGTPRRTCRLVGECDIGCNDGAKNTLDHNYLSAARHHGADLRSRCEVRIVQPLELGGYEVEYVEHDPTSEGKRINTRALPTRVIRCKRLILAAGTYGTTFLLLTNRRAFPGLSTALGTRFSGNGDLLTFLLPDRTMAPRSFAASRGPVITSAIRIGDDLDNDVDKRISRGFYLEDGGYPGFTDWIVERLDLTGRFFRAGEFLTRWLLARLRRSPDTGISAEIARLIGQGRLSNGALPLLGMGRDVPDGVMGLRDGLLDVKWTTRTSLHYFEQVRETIRTIADELDAKYVDNPVWFFKHIMTVHPLGGAPLGRNAFEGVCDAYGEVFGYPGLYVADGAAMPGPVGANPSLTIAAMADRMTTHLLEA
ncbi:GMC family oxidoreductase [Nocardia sp. NBC_00881]|uniref:GMC oxidoreductase n=1 Tax=Nocardia sp. NBC_00881 TaxID=2975995 RepID=UPI003867E08D|nr:GMC family oxidoreductase [Nocardia sp. NBC_00881]